ncbi:MAG: NTP transferase domain-containing protein, partial [Rhodospirillaceae bacterium]
MPTPQTTAIVLAAGMGTRMRSDTPKVMHRLAGLPLVDHVLAGLAAAGIKKATVVLGPEMADQTARFAPHDTVIQTERLGTGHAVKVALEAQNPGESDVLVVYADTPLLTTDTINDLLNEKQNAAIAVLGFRPAEPGAYGRLLTEGDHVESIVEAADATPDELVVDLCNSGVLVANGQKLGGWVKALKNDNTKGEYYLTHVVALARQDGDTCVYTEGEVDELIGINNRADLAAAEEIAQNRYRAAAMAGGVTLQDPTSVFLCHDTTFGTDVEVGPFTVFGPGVTVGSHVTIKGFCHFENATIGDRAVVGPYA